MHPTYFIRKIRCNEYNSWESWRLIVLLDTHHINPVAFISIHSLVCFLCWPLYDYQTRFQYLNQIFGLLMFLLRCQTYIQLYGSWIAHVFVRWYKIYILDMCHWQIIRRCIMSICRRVESLSGTFRNEIDQLWKVSFMVFSFVVYEMPLAV